MKKVEDAGTGGSSADAGRVNDAGNAGNAGHAGPAGDAGNTGAAGHGGGTPDAGDAGHVADAGDAAVPSSVAPCDGGATIGCWVDHDGDGFAAASAAHGTQCGDQCATGWTSTEPAKDAVDCDDGNIDLHPIPCWLDGDGDGYAKVGAKTELQCASDCSAGWTKQEPTGSGADCDDSAASTHPGADESCNDLDDDCDATVDESASTSCTFPHGSGTCDTGGQCKLAGCAAGYADCNSKQVDGCEVALNVDGNCGACGVTCDGQATCKASSPVGVCECNPPTFGDGVQCTGQGPFGFGYGVDCIIQADRTPVCFGQKVDAVTTHLRQVAGGWAHACGLDTSGALSCWATSGGTPLNTPPTGQFIQVVDHYTHVCALATDFHAECWAAAGSGANEHGQRDVPAGEKFRQLTLGTYHSCGIRLDGTVRCWGAGSDPNLRATNDWGQSVAPSGTFMQITAGSLHTCGLHTDGKVECWGAGSTVSSSGYEYGQSITPVDAMTWITAGEYHTCGIRKADGYAQCWGSNDQGQSSVPSSTRFVRLAATYKVSCGLTPGGAVDCWGATTDKNSNNIMAPYLAGPFPINP